MAESSTITTESILFSNNANEIQQNNLPSKKSRVERSNLLNISKICIKSLIDCSLSAGTGRILADTNLEQFFIILEHIIRHGLKAKRTLLGPRKEFMGVLEALENKIGSLPDILTNIRNLSDIKTNLGRTRAWMRLALMQKVLAEQMLAISEEQELLGEWYEENSMMICEEGAVISGMLVGLNAIDYNFDLKGQDLDIHTGIIDISLYLRDGNYLEKIYEEKPTEEGPNDQKIELILDQKAYLEQLNKSLNDTMLDLKQQIQNRKDHDESIDNQNEDLTNRLVSVIAERERYRLDYEILLEEHNKKLETINADLDIERETYMQSRTGLNDMYLDATKQMENESRERKELQILLDQQQAMNREKQVAMQLLEKDIHDKQDTLISLRRQLEDIKKINVELHSKLKSSDASQKKLMLESTELEQNYGHMVTKNKELEKKIALAEGASKQAEDIAHQIGTKLGQLQAEKKSLDTDLQVEREWRVGLQASLDLEKEKYNKISKEMTKASLAEKENIDLRSRLKKTELRLSEQDATLMEMGNKLNKTHTEFDEMKELHAAAKENQWLDDRDAATCQACEQPFSLARRKHHCRNCGGIFCNACSDNTMPLPSSAKPVRVCDTCQETLLAKYSSGTS